MMERRERVEGRKHGRQGVREDGGHKGREQDTTGVRMVGSK